MPAPSTCRRFLRPGDHLVLNDTKVIPARLTGTRDRATPAGSATARIEVTLLEPRPDGTWRALARPLRKLRVGEVVDFGHGLAAEVAALTPQPAFRFNRSGEAFEAALNAAGAMPLPPYIAARRAADARDREDYQAIWARRAGAVAAPTASLHFDDALMVALADRDIGLSHVTLHVGAGTFLPVTVEDVTTHAMHAEWGEITAKAAAAINAARAAGGRIVPVGTTALRLIESAAGADGVVRPWHGETDIFIYPGFRFRATDALVTNFHLPRSTLLMLVSALMGQGVMQAAYAHAVAQGYRFFSYGDASLLIPSRTEQTTTAPSPSG